MRKTKMSRYIIVTKVLWTETDLVEAKTEAEAFQKVVDGDTLKGYAEGERPKLISTYNIGIIYNKFFECLHSGIAYKIWVKH